MTKPKPSSGQPGRRRGIRRTNIQSSADRSRMVTQMRMRLADMAIEAMRRKPGTDISMAVKNLGLGTVEAEQEVIRLIEAKLKNRN